MKTKVLLTLFCAIIASISHAKNLRVYAMHHTFKSNDNTGITIEHLLSFDGYTTNAVKVTDGYQASIRVALVVSDVSGNVAYTNTYNVLSPVQKKIRLSGEFIDIQRFTLPSGNYTLALTINDNNDTVKAITNTQPIYAPASYNDSLQFSSIELVESFVASTDNKPSVKNGFDIIPYVSTYYGNSATQLNFYVELYNAAKYLGADQPYLIKYYLENADTHQPLNDYGNYTRQKATNKFGFFGALPLANLPTGNYILHTNVVDKTNTVHAQNQLFVQRYAPASVSTYNPADSANNWFTQITNMDTLNDLVRSIKPAAKAGQKPFIDNVGKDTLIKLKQQFLYNFWLDFKTNNPYRYAELKGKDARDVFEKYMKEVTVVNAKYKTTIRKGYQSDRGRVVLQYGTPSQVTAFDREPNSFPYEIWQYNTTDKRNNRRFVFYNPSLSANEYTLIHSDAYGELKNERWQLLIANRNGKITGIDATETPSIYGDHIKDAYYQLDKNNLPLIKGTRP